MVWFYRKSDLRKDNTSKSARTFVNTMGDAELVLSDHWTLNKAESIVALSNV